MFDLLYGSDDCVGQCCSLSLLVTILRLFYPEPHEDWSKINVEEINFLRDFLGIVPHHTRLKAIISTTGLNLKERNKGKRTHVITGTGGKNDHQLLLELGVNSYRFSIEWSRIQFTEEGWDKCNHCLLKKVDSLLGRALNGNYSSLFPSCLV